MAYLVDSVILIDHFNGIDAATRFISQHRDYIAISVITRAEVLAGFDTEQTLLVKPFLQLLNTHRIETPDADLAAILRREHRWKLPDALQAAVALNRGLSLATRNSKDFSPQRHGFVEVPYTLPA